MKTSLYLFASLLLLTACSDDDDDNNMEPNPTSANIMGSVNLYDDGTTQIDSDGMTITIEDSDPAISATTDDDGDFTLENVSFGTYTLVYEKAGYGTFKIVDLSHSTDGSSTIITNNPSLGQSSTTEVTDLQSSISGADVILSVTTDPAGNNGNQRYIRYFLSTDSDVSSENYQAVSEGLISQINPIDLTLSASDLSDFGFTSGQTVYARVYGDSFWSNQYDDSDLGRTIFPNLNASSAASVSFVVP